MNSDKVCEAKSINNKIDIYKHPFVVFGVLSLLLTIYMFFQNGLLDDGVFHLGRLSAFAKELSITNPKPIVYSTTYYNAGYPLGIFYPDLFLYPFAIITKLGVDVYYAFLLLIVSINFFSSVSAYYAIKKILSYNQYDNGSKILFFVGIFYMMYPYRIYDVYSRMAIGECFAFIFIPWIVLGVYEIFYTEKNGMALFYGMAGLVCSHFLSVGMTVAVLVVFYVLNIKKIVQKPVIVLKTFYNAFFTVISTLFITLPLLEMQSFSHMKYTTLHKTFGLLEDHCISIVKNDYVALIVAIFLIGVCVIVSNRVGLNGKLTISVCFFVFMFTDVFPWGFLEKHIPGLNIVQFPYRFLIFAGMPFAYLLATVLGKKVEAVATGFVVISLIICVYFGKFVYIPLDVVSEKIGNASNNIGKGEYLPVESDRWDFAQDKFEDVSNEYGIVRRKNSFAFDTREEFVVLPIICYKGYRISDSLGNIYEYKSNDGLIEVENVNNKELIVTYEGTSIQRISLGISLGAFLLICFLNKLYRKKS